MIAQLKSYLGPFETAPRPVIAVLGLAVAFAVFGIGSAVSTRHQLAGLKAEIAGAGLDTSNLRALEQSIVDKQRQVTRLENAIVSLQAAVEARTRQVGASIAKFEAVETASATAVKAADAATAASVALGQAIEDRTRDLTRTENALTAAAAAVEARRAQLAGVVGELDRNAAVVAEVSRYQADKAALVEQAAALGRAVTGLENKIVALTAAAGAREAQVARAITTRDEAEVAQRKAAADVLALSAEALGLERAITRLADARAEAQRGETEASNRLVAANAAAAKREAEVATLAATTEVMARRHAELTAENDALAALIVDADQKLVRMVEATRKAADALATVETAVGAGAAKP